MNRSLASILSALLIVVLLMVLLGGNQISCHESFWDKDKQIIEIKHK